MSCFHCQDSHGCPCIVCGEDRLIDGAIVRVAGHCAVCRAREFTERHRSILEMPANDPSDRRNWEYIPKSDGNKAIWRYKPWIGLK